VEMGQGQTGLDCSFLTECRQCTVRSPTVPQPLPHTLVRDMTGTLRSRVHNPNPYPNPNPNP